MTPVTCSTKCVLYYLSVLTTGLDTWRWGAHCGQKPRSTGEIPDHSCGAGKVEVTVMLIFIFSGATSEVKLAKSKDDDKEVALKVITSHTCVVVGNIQTHRNTSDVHLSMARHFKEFKAMPKSKHCPSFWGFFRWRGRLFSAWTTGWNCCKCSSQERSAMDWSWCKPGCVTSTESPGSRW